MQRAWTAVIGLLLVASAAGCQSLHPFHRVPGDLPAMPVPCDMPRELSKVVLPTYRIEPPDILAIEAVRLVPRADYKLNTIDVVQMQVRRTALNRLAPFDVLLIQAPGAPELAPIDGQYQVQANGLVVLGPPYGSVDVGFLTLEEAERKIEEHLADSLVTPDVSLTLAEAGMPVDGQFSIGLDGTVDFGHPYGSVMIAGMTIDQAKTAIAEHFAKFFDDPVVSMVVVETAFQQQVTGEHLVGPDGTITLGMYGTIPIVGLTVDEAAWQIEQHLTQFLDSPRVAVTVFSYNSKVYYIITEGAGFGDRVFRFPITGNDTVLDALAQINGLSEVSSSRMWIARPSPIAGECQILPVDWCQLTSLAATESNYQLLPGDRLYVAQDALVAFDRTLAKWITPFERLMGFSILGAETATRFSGRVLQGGGNPVGRGF